jgi:hypothetical protein
MAWDAELGEMVLVLPVSSTSASVGQTWIWFNRSWVKKGPPSPFIANGLVLADDPGTRAFMAVSCCGATQASSGVGSTQSWRWDGSGWRRLAITANPAAGALLGLGWDAATRSFLLGTELSLGSQGPAALWRFDGHAWIAVNAAAAPDISSGDTLVDTSVGVVLLVGASNVASDNSAPIYMWSLEGGSWRQIA